MRATTWLTLMGTALCAWAMGASVAAISAGQGPGAMPLLVVAFGVVALCVAETYAPRRR